MQRNEILAWLRETDSARLADLWQLADQTRQQFVGGEVHLRGLVELSNYCVRLCGYCGLRAGNHGLHRYRMSDDEILACARQAVEFGYGTVVLQSGEDPGIDLPTGSPDWSGGSRPRRRWPSRSAWASATTTNWPPGARPGPTATCCGLRPPTARCTSGSIRRGRATRSDRIADAAARCGGWATKSAAA